MNTRLRDLRFYSGDQFGDWKDSDGTNVSCDDVLQFIKERKAEGLGDADILKLLGNELS